MTTLILAGDYYPKLGYSHQQGAMFYYVDSDMIWIDKIMTIEPAHKKYGKI